MKKIILDRVGEKYPTREGDEVKVIEYFNSRNVTIQFKDGTITKNNQFSPIKRGTLKNPNTPSVCGIGYMGQGKYKSKINGKPTKSHQTWVNIIKRAYTEVYQIRFPTYKGVTVCEEWKCYQNFAEWYENNYIEGWHLDKDLLIKGNKIYRPEACCFVPYRINSIFQINFNQRGDLPIGVGRKGKKFIAQFTMNGVHISLGSFSTLDEAFQTYKVAKEKYVKETAEYFKDRLDLRIYDMLIKYEVKTED